MPPALEPAARDAVRDRILKAVDAARAQGLQIVSGDWSVDTKGDAWVPIDECACPLGAVLLAEQPRASWEHEYKGDVQDHTAGRQLGMPQGFIVGFINGFDGADLPQGKVVAHLDQADIADGYALGVEIRMTVGPVKKDELMAARGSMDAENDEDDLLT